MSRSCTPHVPQRVLRQEPDRHMTRRRLREHRPLPVVERRECTEEAVVGRDELIEHLARREGPHRLDHQRRMGGGIERGEHTGRRSGESRVHRRGPERVDSHEVGDDILHRPAVAPARRRPFLVVEPVEYRFHPAPLSGHHDGLIVGPPVDRENCRRVVPGRQLHAANLSVVRDERGELFAEQRPELERVPDVPAPTTIPSMRRTMKRSSAVLS